MASNAGTGWGSESVKKGSADVIPKKYPTRAKRMLLSEIGKYNKHSPQDPSRPSYQKKFFWIGAGLVLVRLGLIATGILATKGLIGTGAVSYIASTCFPVSTSPK